MDGGRFGGGIADCRCGPGGGEVSGYGLWEKRGGGVSCLKWEGRGWKGIEGKRREFNVEQVRKLWYLQLSQ